MKALIEAGAAGVHYEDQLAAEKKCGHLGGKVLVPTSQFIRTLVAARLAADVLDVPTLLIARTDALSADAADERRRSRRRGVPDRRADTPRASSASATGWIAAIARSLAYAPYADLLWFETSTPDLGEAREFAQRSTSATPASCWPTTARRRSTGAGIWATARSRRSRTTSAPSATASSSSPSPASMR